MNNLNTNTQQLFLNYLDSKLSSHDFETYLYSSETLESELGNELYLELISINYKHTDCRSAVNKLISPFLNYGEMHKTMITNTINNILAKKVNILDGISELNGWCWKGYTFLGEIDIISDIGDAGRSVIHIIKDSDTEDEIRNKIERYEPGLIPFLENVKTRLSDGKIVLTGKKVQHHQSGVFFEFEKK
ncbi:hypothetical protein [Haliscomenobacter sp.]|uniref:hypothetical protein n=1 Tax=Haliscomenobacter sp. TaxID=2717303 RepID=UPI003BAA57CF